MFEARLLEEPLRLAIVPAFFVAVHPAEPPANLAIIRQIECSLLLIGPCATRGDSGIRPEDLIKQGSDPQV